ncbi:hypothetical protein LTR53_011350 [Teratosphaeriaceae sp. CCFEE 6253]|nr:hypothetical protein LTR53_011350 [Teratosphaeriaceae sp. CCFEE 6253]
MASSPVAKDWRMKAESASDVCLAHPRVWLLGDAIHAMLPTRGMGGNQAMRDTATILPILVRLDRQYRESRQLSRGVVKQACAEYEDEMIPRAFSWVRKSGGRTIVPVDTGSWAGWAILSAVAGGLQLASVFRVLTAPFLSQSKYVDDAPELRN